MCFWYHDGAQAAMQAHPVMQAFIDTAIAAAQAASNPIMQRYRGGFEVEIKADASPVTIADREAETVIRKVLTEAFPDHGIYGEEFGTDQPDAEYLWLVDPIDGTKSFVRGTGMFSTQIALMHEGRIVLGVSSAPAHGELAWAARDRGAWLNGERLQIAATSALADTHLSLGNMNTLARDRDAWLALGELIPRVNRLRGYGDYYHYHCLAAGQLDAVIESDVNILDIAALSVLVEEAGGRFTDLQGRALDLETTSVLAATQALHPQLLASLHPAEMS